MSNSHDNTHYPFPDVSSTAVGYLTFEGGDMIINQNTCTLNPSVMTIGYTDDYEANKCLKQGNVAL